MGTKIGEKMKTLVDTCIFINVLEDEPGADESHAFLEKILKGKITGFVSVITIAELYSRYGKVSDRAASFAKGLILRIIDEKNVIPVLLLVAESAGKLKVKYPKLSLTDSLILATALLMRCDALITRDPALAGVEEIKVLRPEEVKLGA